MLCAYCEIIICLFETSYAGAYPAGVTKKKDELILSDVYQFGFVVYKWIHKDFDFHVYFRLNHVSRSSNKADRVTLEQ